MWGWVAEGNLERGFSLPRTEHQDYVGPTVEPQVKSPDALPVWFNSLTCQLAVNSKNLH